MASNTVSIFIGTVSGGNVQPITSGAYDLRVSPFSSAGISGTHVSNGMWAFTGISDTAEYKLYDTTGGTEFTGFTGGGSNTRAFYDTDLQTYLNKTTTSPQSVTAQVTFGSSGIKTDIILEKTSTAGVLIDSALIKDGQLQGTAPILADTISEYGSGNGVTVDGILLKDNIYTGHTGRALLAESNVLIVDANRSSDVTGYVYNTIQEAIDYAQSQTPSTTSRWTIKIVPHKNTASYNGYAESLTLYKYIDLVGLGMVMCNCVFSYSGTWTGGTYARIKNLIVRPDVDTNLTIRGIEADNCHFGVEEDNLTPVMSLENSQFTSCGFWKFGTVTTPHASTGSNYIMNCIGNSSIAWDSTDSVWGYDYINDATKYFKLT